MSNTMAAHEPINYLDSILNEEEKRCEYSHQWRNFTISRSGRFKSKNKKRDVVDGQLFDANGGLPAKSNECTRSAPKFLEQDNKISSRQSTNNTNSRVREKLETYKSYYETNL